MLGRAAHADRHLAVTRSKHRAQRRCSFPEAGSAVSLSARDAVSGVVLVADLISGLGSDDG